MPAVSSGNDWLDVIVALIVLAGVVTPAVISFITSRRVKTMKNDIATNHGKKPAEYLEMVADIRETQVEMRFGQIEIKEALARHAKALSEHTEQDSKNFAELRKLITESAD